MDKIWVVAVRLGNLYITIIGAQSENMYYILCYETVSIAK